MFRSIVIALALCIVTPAAIIAQATPPKDGIVRVEGGKFTLDGERYRFVGVNVYSLLSRPKGQGFSCGRSWTDGQIVQLLDEIKDMRVNVVRIFAYQSYLRDPKDPAALDFSRLSFVLEEGKKRGLKFIVALESQWWNCTRGGYKYADWYIEGYKKPYGSYRLSYRDFVAQVVARYKGDPGILAWQLLNEAETKTTDGNGAPDPLFAFAEDMLGVIDAHDGTHLAHLGTIGLDRPGSGGPFYALLHAGDGPNTSDIVEAHDYDERSEFPQLVREAQIVARRLGKPFIIGELGVKRIPGKTPLETRRLARERSVKLRDKVLAALREDVDGILIWSYRAGDGSGYDFTKEDGFYNELRSVGWSYFDQKD